MQYKQKKLFQFFNILYFNTSVIVWRLELSRVTASGAPGWILTKLETASKTWKNK